VATANLPAQIKLDKSTAEKASQHSQQAKAK
jgi:hypothetical protein